MFFVLQVVLVLTLQATLSIKHIIQKLHLNKKDKDRRKLCRNYNSNVRKGLAHRAQVVM